MTAPRLAALLQACILVLATATALASELPRVVPSRQDGGSARPVSLAEAAVVLHVYELQGQETPEYVKRDLVVTLASCPSGGSAVRFQIGRRPSHAKEAEGPHWLLDDEADEPDGTFTCGTATFSPVLDEESHNLIGFDIPPDTTP